MQRASFTALSWSTSTERIRPLSLTSKRDAVRIQQIERRERRRRHQAGMKAGRAKWRFVLQRRSRTTSPPRAFPLFAPARSRLLHIADHRRIHFERHALLQPKAHQRLLFLQDRTGRCRNRAPPRARSNPAESRPRGACDGRWRAPARECAPAKLAAAGYCRAPAKPAARRARKARIPPARAPDTGANAMPFFGKLEGVRGRRILEKIGERHRGSAANLR